MKKKKSSAKIVLGVVSGALAAGAAGCARNAYDQNGNNAVGRAYGGGGYYGGTRIRPGIGTGFSSGTMRSSPGTGSVQSSPRGGFGSTGRSGGGFFSGS